MTYINKIIFIGFLFVVISISSCIDDESLIESREDQSSLTSEILHFIESNGDHVNSPQFPALIDAEELFNNLTDYNIIDVRSPEEFNRGRISGAVNVSNINLFDYIMERKDEKIALVSASGQSASYFTALMRLYGIRNIFALKFGMASWHQDFADVWQEALQSRFALPFNNILYKKEELKKLPTINGNYEGLSAREMVESRIRGQILDGYIDTMIDNEESSSSESTITYNSVAQIQNKYMICYGRLGLYYLGSLGCLDCLGHAPETTWYVSDAPYELKSTKFLQTLPTDRPIIIYSYGGQTSAMATAHLRLLGYDVRSVLFGAHNIFYSRLVSTLSFTNLIYTTDNVKNYPYVIQ